MTMDRQTFALKGFVKTLTPLSQNPYTNRSTPNGENHQRMGRLKIVTPDNAVENSDGVIRGMVTEVPVFSANGMRGMLRRACAEVILDKFLAEGVKAPVHVVQWMFAGAARNAKETLSKAALPALIQDETMISGNIHAGLFGGGLGLPSAFKIEDLVPCVDEVNTAGLLEDISTIADLPKAWEILGFRGWVRVDDLSRRDSGHKLRFFDASDLEEALALAEEERKKRNRANKSKAKAKSDGETYVGEDDLGVAAGQLGIVEYIAPGVSMVFRAFFDHVAPAQVGLFIKGLERFGDDPRIGSNARWGFGRVSLMLEDDLGRRVSVGDGSFTQDGFDAEIEAFENWLGQVDVDRLDTMAILPTDKKEKESK